MRRSGSRRRSITAGSRSSNGSLPMVMSSAITAGRSANGWVSVMNEVKRASSPYRAAAAVGDVVAVIACILLPPPEHDLPFLEVGLEVFLQVVPHQRRAGRIGHAVHASVVAFSERHEGGADARVALDRGDDCALARFGLVEGHLELPQRAVAVGQ